MKINPTVTSICCNFIMKTKHNEDTRSQQLIPNTNPYLYHDVQTHTHTKLKQNISLPLYNKKCRLKNKPQDTVHITVACFTYLIRPYAN